MITYLGVGDVARLCGADQTTVSHWLRRYPQGIPQPDAVVSGLPGWLDEDEIREAWTTFARCPWLRHGQLATRETRQALRLERHEATMPPYTAIPGTGNEARALREWQAQNPGMQIPDSRAVPDARV